LLNNELRAKRIARHRWRARIETNKYGSHNVARIGDRPPSMAGAD